MRRCYGRLRKVTALFKKHPPVRHVTRETSDAVQEYDRSADLSASLKERCVEFICREERWKSPNIIKQMMSLPVEVVERILTHLHRTERLDLSTLSSFQVFHVETLFLSNIRAMSDQWLAELKNYSSLTYLDLSHSYRITDRYVIVQFSHAHVLLFIYSPFPVASQTV